MLKTCNICGNIHDFDKVCYTPRYKKVLNKISLGTHIYGRRKETR